MSENIRDEENKIDAELREELQKRRVYAIDDVQDGLKTALIRLRNRMRQGFAFNSNITICAGEQETSNEYGDVLAELLEKEFTESCLIRIMNEKDFYNQKSTDTNLKEYQVWVVKDYAASSPKRLFEILSKIEAEGWSTAVILCTTVQAAEALKEYPDMDYRLYHYLCGYKVHTPEIDDNYIQELTIQRLEQEGFELTEGFKKKLALYIRVVYRDAWLKKNAFFEDLIERIYQVHFGKIVDGRQLDESDVPKSDKADEQERREREDTTVTIEENEAETHVQKPQTAENPHTDVLLLAMSTFPLNKVIRRTEFSVKDNPDFKITGRSQLDPIPKYVAKQLEMENECLDKIIILATKDTMIEQEITTPEKTKETISPVGYFKKQTRGYLNPEGIDDQEKFDQKRFCIVEVDEANPAKGIGDILRILRGEEGKLRLHMAMNGGLRGIQRLLEAMIVLLRAEGITVDGAYSIEMGGVCRIINETERLKIFEFVSGMNQFYYDGRINALDQYLKKDNPLTDAIKMVADGISWCNVKNFEGGLDNLRKFYANKAQSLDDSYLELFKDTIKQDFKDLLSPDRTVLDEIEWCMNKRFYQPALTLLEARMSKTLIDKQFLTLTTDGERSKFKNNIEDNDLFNGLVHSISVSQMYNKNFNEMDEKDYEDYMKYANDHKCKLNVNFDENNYSITAKSRKGDIEVSKPFQIKQGGKLLVEFLFLHKTLKTVRNEMNHANENFRYDENKIKLALQYYIQWAKQLLCTKPGTETLQASVK